MRSWLIRGMVGVLAAGAVGFLFLPIMPATPTSTEMHLDLADGGGGGGGGLAPAMPGNCSTWHELYPSYCASHHQDDFIDNGDGVLSPCDMIVLDGLKYHITWVGPTYYTTRYGPGGAEPKVFEPATQNPSANPVCEIWHEVWPQFCQQIHVDSWHDGNGNGVLDACDEIDVIEVPGQPPVFYHIDKVGVDITIEGPIPARKTTLGAIKDLFR